MSARPGLSISVKFTLAVLCTVLTISVATTAMPRSLRSVKFLINIERIASRPPTCSNNPE